MEIFLGIIIVSLATNVFGLECFVGEVTRPWSDKILNEDFKKQRCPPQEDACETKIEARWMTRKVAKTCRTYGACMTKYVNNAEKCYSRHAFDIAARYCYYCCKGESFCNARYSDIPTRNPTLT